MHLLIGLAAVVAAICYFILRTRKTVDAVKQLDRETKTLQHKARGAVTAMIGTPLGRVRDPALAAAVLMVQLVRSEGAMAAEEKTAILARLADPIGASDPQALFEQAWRLTAQEAFFSQVSDEMLPLLQSRLTGPEKLDLVEMLRGVAEIWNGPSELQGSSIARLARRFAVTAPAEEGARP